MKGLETTYWELHAKEILKEKGVSNTELAKRLGILPQNVKKWIETKSVVNLDKIANALNLDLVYLIYGNAEPVKNNIDGFVEINGTVHRINCKSDIEALLEII